jgi:hypothetical protein
MDADDKTKATWRNTDRGDLWEMVSLATKRVLVMAAFLVENHKNRLSRMSPEFPQLYKYFSAGPCFHCSNVSLIYLLHPPQHS